jgi:hypothetical protein
MNYRRTTNGLKPKQVKELKAGWDHAARIGLRLNAFVTIRPTAIHDPSAFCDLWRSIRNKLGTYARQHGFPFVAAWSRECHPDGSGEHFHVLMHVPKKHFEKLSSTAISRFPEPGVVDVRPAHQNVSISETGIRYSAIGYISKQMTPQAWWGRGLNRQNGGPILGKRGGVTRNIGPAAIDQYFIRQRCLRAAAYLWRRYLRGYLWKAPARQFLFLCRME